MGWITLLITLFTGLISGYLQGMYHIQPTDPHSQLRTTPIKQMQTYLPLLGVRSHDRYKLFHDLNRLEIVLFLATGWVLHLFWLWDGVIWAKIGFGVVILAWTWEVREVGYNLARYGVVFNHRENFLGEEDGDGANEEFYAALFHITRLAVGFAVVLILI